jgi:hypothetical protein
VVGTGAALDYSGNCFVIIGHSAGKALTSGDTQTILGSGAGASLTTGGGNTILGYQALYAATTGNTNTAVGRFAGYDATGSGNMFIGNYAGSYESGNNKFMLDQIHRQTEANARVSSLMYGEFNAANLANQHLRINAGYLELGSTGVFASSGTIRFPYGGSVYQRNNSNDADLALIRGHVVDANDSYLGNDIGITKIQSSLAQPSAAHNGDWWVQCAGSSPSRECSLKVMDGGVTLTLATITH